MKRSEFYQMMEDCASDLQSDLGLDDYEGAVPDVAESFLTDPEIVAFLVSEGITDELEQKEFIMGCI